MKKILALLSAILSVIFPFFCGCSVSPKKDRYTVVYNDLFDTVCSFTAETTGKEAFDILQEELYALLVHFNNQSDVYDCHGISNLKTVNDEAGKKAVKVDSSLIDFMSFCLESAKETDGIFNPLSGAVTKLWKQATENALPPSPDILQNAGKHIDYTTLIIDKQAGTLYISDPEASIDVGAVAKGYAAKLAGEFLNEHGIDNWLLALGGSIYAHGSDPKTRVPWVVGVQDPFTSEGKSIASYNILNLSVVTGGSYERFFDYEGRRYHHIIDPETLYPAESGGNVSVTIFSSDPAIGDVLSTVLFILPSEKGEKFLEKYQAKALWIDNEGNLRESEGLEALKNIKEMKDRSAPPVFITLLLLSGICLLLLYVRNKESFTEKKINKPLKEKKQLSSPFQEFKKRDRIALLVVVLFLAVLCLFAVTGKDSGKQLYAVVRVGGNEQCVLPLNQDTTYEVSSSLGTNLIVIKNGQVYISEANCPGKDCVHSGSIDGESFPSVIACLPHKLTITVEERENKK